MKKYFALVLIIAALTGALQAQGNTYFSAGVGIPREPGDFSKYWKPGISLSGGVDAPFSDWLALTGGFDFSNFPLNEEEYIKGQGVAGTGVGISGGTASILTLMGGAKLTFIAIPKKFFAYLSGTVGYLNFSTTDFEVSGGGLLGTLTGEEKSAFSSSVGAGAGVPFGKNTELFLEGQYVIGFSENRTVYLPIRLGLRIRL